MARVLGTCSHSRRVLLGVRWMPPGGRRCLEHVGGGCGSAVVSREWCGCGGLIGGGG